MNASSSDKTRMRRRVVKRTLTALISVGIVAGIGLALVPKPVAVESASADIGVLRVTVNEDGVARIVDRYNVSSAITGTLARIALRPGDEVKQGQVLAHILPLTSPLLDARSKSEAASRVNGALASVRQADAQIERAKAALDYAKQDHDSTKKLFETGAITRNEMERAELELRSRQAELTSAQFGAKVAAHELSMARSALGRFNNDASKDQDQFEITSPVSGRVLQVYQESEGVVQAGARLIELGDPKALEIAVDVLTSDAVNIHPSAETSIEQWGGPPLRASVRLVEPSAFTRLSALGVEEQRVNALIDLQSPYEDWTKLSDGYRVEARILVYENVQAVRIPWSALFRHDGKWAAFVIEEQKARLRPLEVGQRNDTYAEIIQGLKSGAQVILHPSDRVKDGVSVAVSN